MGTEIIRVEHADFDGTGETISVTAIAGNEERTFHVQTHQGRYRPGLGCLITSDDDDEDVSFFAYPNFDFDKIIGEANKLARTKINKTEIYLENWGYAYTIENNRGFILAFENDGYLNDDTSFYIEEYYEVSEENGDLVIFETEEEALECARKMQGGADECGGLIVFDTLYEALEHARNN